MSSQSSQQSASRFSNRNALERSAKGIHHQPFSVRPSVPATFTTKLYAMIEDESQSLITWSASGDRFRVHNVNEFSRTVLPQYFKHSNWPSFVRQLNMYGFRKVSNGLQGINDSAASSSSSSDPSRQIWEFKHDDFRKGAQNRLHLIRRKTTRTPRSPFQYRFAHNMETLQDIQDTDVHGSSPQNLDGQSQTRLQETEQALQSLQLRAQELFQELNELEVLASRQHAIISQAIDVLGGILEHRAKSVGWEETSFSHLKRAFRDIVPPDTRTFTRDHHHYVVQNATETDQGFSSCYDPISDKSYYRPDNSEKSDGDEWARSIKRKESPSSMDPCLKTLSTTSQDTRDSLGG